LIRINPKRFRCTRDDFEAGRFQCATPAALRSPFGHQPAAQELSGHGLLVDRRRGSPLLAENAHPHRTPGRPLRSDAHAWTRVGLTLARSGSRKLSWTAHLARGPTLRDGVGVRIELAMIRSRNRHHLRRRSAKSKLARNRCRQALMGLQISLINFCLLRRRRY